MQYNWSLNNISHSYLDRIKLALFFLNPRNRWTIGDKVKEFEEKFARYLGVNYVVATSSGSTANSILSHSWFDKNKKDIKNGKNQAIFAGITWTTNCSPFIRDGFQPIFLDINLQNFSIDYNKLEKYLEENYKKVSCVFVTSLIGYSPRIQDLEKLCNSYNVKLMIDCCESTMSKIYDGDNWGNWLNIGSLVTSSHSFYLGHLVNGCEMGCVATNDEREYQEFLLYRNHGLLRVIKDLNIKDSGCLYNELQNKLVDEKFCFSRIANNYRPVEINAYTAILDLKRSDFYKKRRKSLFSLFNQTLDTNKFYLPYENNLEVDNVHFCLPIIINPKYRKSKANLISAAKKYCDDNLIERRPIISATMTRNECYKQYGDYKTLKNCEYLTKFGFYIGLNPKVKEDQIITLTKFLNKL